MLTFEDFDMSPSADQLALIYDNGFKGVIKDSAADEALYASAPGFHESFPEAVGAGKGRLSTPYKACIILDPEYGRCESQTTGDCLLADAKVRMADGSLKNVADVNVGDVVISGKNNARRVSDVICKPYSGELVTIKVRGHEQEITATPDHLFVKAPTSNLDIQEWVPIALIDVGDYVMVLCDDQLEAAQVISFEGSTHDGNVYCLVVEEDHSFIANGYAVHNCVSHSTRNAGMVDYCVDALFGETEYKGRFATENIYGYRGHAGQGASCSRLANYVGPDGPGGFLPRGVYKDPSGSGSVDLTKYSSGIGARWGWSGTPTWLNEIAAGNKAERVFKCTSIEEARDAIASGFGLSRCGWWGYSRKRDENGVSGVSGRWAHAMAVHGADDTDSAKKIDPDGIFCVQNSWGLWNSGPKRAEQPDGSFWVAGARLKSEIAQGGVFVIASVRGFNRTAVAELITKVAELSAS